MYIGPGSDGSSADKLSLDLKFNPRNTAIPSRPEWHSMSKTVFTQYDLHESWCTEHKGAWLDDVKTICYRPIRSLVVGHSYFLTRRDTESLAKSVHLSRVKMHINVSRFPSNPFKDKYPTLNERQRNETSNSQTLATKTKLASQNFLTSTISHDRTIEYTMISAVKASGNTVGHSFKMFDPGKNGFQLNCDSTSKLRNELVLDDANENFYVYITSG